MSNSYQDFYVFIFLEHRHFELSLSPRYNNKGTSSQSPLSTLIHLEDFVGKEIVKQNEKLLSAFVFSYSFWLVLIGFLFLRNVLCLRVLAFLFCFSAASCKRFRRIWTWWPSVKIRIWRCCGMPDFSFCAWVNSYFSAYRHFLLRQRNWISLLFA